MDTKVSEGHTASIFRCHNQKTTCTWSSFQRHWDFSQTATSRKGAEGSAPGD